MPRTAEDRLTALVDQAALPSLWPGLRSVDTTVDGKGSRVWTFHYDDGTRAQTRDPVEAERVTRLYFPPASGHKTNPPTSSIAASTISKMENKGP